MPLFIFFINKFVFFFSDAESSQSMKNNFQHVFFTAREVGRALCDTQVSLIFQNDDNQFESTVFRQELIVNLIKKQNTINHVRLLVSEQSFTLVLTQLGLIARLQILRESRFNCRYIWFICWCMTALSLLWSQVALLKTGTGFTWKGSDQLFESSTMWFRTWLTH